MKFEYDILERFIERRANVHIAIGEGRAVVEDESLIGLRVARADLGVQIVSIPLLKPLRFTLDKPASWENRSAAGSRVI